MTIDFIVLKKNDLYLSMITGEIDWTEDIDEACVWEFEDMLNTFAQKNGIEDYEIVDYLVQI